MAEINLPKLMLNGEELQKINIIGEGGMGLTLGLTYKNNPTKYPLLICKLYKKHYDWITKNLQNYSILYKNGISPKLLGIQITDSNYYYYCKTHKHKKYEKCKYDNHIYYYEIAGICTLNQFIKLSTLVDFNNYNLIIKYIDITLKKAILLSSKLNIIHPDLHTSNIMIFNKNTLYLFNKFIMFDKIKNIKHKQFDEKKKYFINLISDVLLNKNSIKGYTNKDLSKSTNKIKLLYDNKLDIKIIDCDRIRNINEIIKTFGSKYDPNDKKVNEIFELIYYSLKYLNIIQFLESFINNCIILYKKYKNENIQKILKYCNNLQNKYCEEMYSKSKIYKKINDNNLKYTLFNFILKGIFFTETQEHFDKIYDLIKNKSYIDYYNKYKFNEQMISNIRNYIIELLNV